MKEVLTICHLMLMAVVGSILIHGLTTMYIKEQIRIGWEENDRKVRELYEKGQ